MPLARPLATLSLALIALGSTAFADVVPHALFAPNAVLQRDQPLPVWGLADPGEKVAVTLADARAETTADAEGRWLVRLPAQPAGGPHTLVLTGNNRIELPDIWLGEVWLCSGQSNMERELGPRRGQPLIENWQAEAASANYPRIRHFTVDRRPSATPRTDTKGAWLVCYPETAPRFTAVGYFFARDLHRALDGVAIGLIHSSWGGTPVEAWTSREVLQSVVPQTVANYDRAVANFPAQLAAYQADEPRILAEWTAATEKAAAEAKPAPRKPGPPSSPAEKPGSPATLYQGMIQPLIPYALRGVLWYQGETNAGNSALYRKTFPALIADWRARWQSPDLPFLFVQLAPYKKLPPEIREAQFLVWRATPGTAMVVTTDAGDADDIHPARKEPVGQRLALAARSLAYGHEIVSSGPIFTGATFADGRATVRFDSLGGGLVAQDGPLRGFTVSADGKTFVPASAEIRGDTVVVSTPEIQAPVAVRYGWANVPDVNLANTAGLPASPFRSDAP